MKNSIQIITEVIDSNSKLAKIKEIEIKKNSNVQCIFLLSDNAREFFQKRVISVKENAHARFYFCYFGKDDINARLHYNINKNARVEHNVVFFVSGSQKFYLNESYQFISTGSFGRFNVNGFVGGKARSNFVGNIMIDKGAQKTDSRLEASTYLLSETAQSVMVPSLQIEANDVKAGHAGKVSHISEEDLFYLNSRGLSETQAKELIVEGLFLEFVSELDDATKKNILNIVKKRYQ